MNHFLEQQKILEQARDAIEGLPDVSNVYSQTLMGREGITNKPDLELELDILGRPVRILAEAKTRAYPRDVEIAMSHLRRLEKQNNDMHQVLMLVAPSISAQSREMLRREGFAYWDQGGSLYLRVPWALIFIDHPSFGATLRKTTSLYRGRTAQVLHALLAEPGRAWHLDELAELADVSTYTAHQVMKYLEDHLWVETRGSGPARTRVVTEPGSVLDAWAEAHSLKEYKFHRFYHWAQSPVALRQNVTTALEELRVDYALTLDSGAEMVAPYTTGVEELSVLISNDHVIEQLAKKLDLEPVESGANVVLLVTRDQYPLMFPQRISQTYTASLVQLYLDLWASPRRGREQAAYLRAQHLSY